MFINTIKEGINATHKNWQLILIHLTVMIVSNVGFFVIVGIPIVIAFIIIGLDLTEILRFDNAADVLERPDELLGKYFAIAVALAFSLFLFFAFIVVLWVFTISATAGVLRSSVLNSYHKFSLKTFFAEGKNLFFPVLFFSIIISIIFIAFVILFTILGSGAWAIIETAKIGDTTLAFFLSVFFSLLILTIGIFSAIATLSLAIYGVACLAFNRYRTLDTLKKTTRYLYSTPSSMGFYSMLLLAFAVVGFIVILLGSPLVLIPAIGIIIYLPYQLIAYVIQAYVGLIILASIFHYYYKTCFSSPLLLSTPDSDISHDIKNEQAFAPGEMGESQRS